MYVKNMRVLNPIKTFFHIKWASCHSHKVSSEVTDGGNDLKIRKVDANIHVLNMQSQTVNKVLAFGLATG